MRWLEAVFVLGLGAGLGQGQGTASKDATVGSGIVTGHVVFGDTGGPARFSKVLLKATTPSENKDDLLSALSEAGRKNDKSKLSADDQAEVAKARAASSKLFALIMDMMIAATVSGDGSYTFTHVRPGTYYVHATAPGYIDPLTQFTSDDLASTDPAMRQRIAAVATTITVTGSGDVKADLRLERGAAISGRVLYDDGTPAVGWTVKVVNPAAGAADAGGLATLGVDASDVDLSHPASTTDDTGRFRIAGLPSGSYVLRARLAMSPLGHSAFDPVPSNSGSPFGGGLAQALGLRMTVYSGGVFRQAEAKAIDLKDGEERADYEVSVPLHRMHSVAGSVRAKADGHAVNGGRVELTAEDANGKEDGTLHLTMPIGMDGSFRFDYVPSGVTYAVKVSHAVDANTVSTRQMFGSLIAEQKTTRSYGSATAIAVVGDTDLLDLKLDVPEVEATGR